MNKDSTDFKNFLVQEGYLTAVEFEIALKEAESRGQDINSMLIQKGFFSEDLLAQVLGKYFKAPYVDFRREKIDPELLTLIPEAVASKRQIILFKKDDKGFHVGMADPSDLETLQFLRSKLGGEVVVYITSKESLREGLLRYKTSIQKEFNQIISDAAKKAEKLKGGLTEIARDLPVIQIFDALLSYAVAERAADIHVEPVEEFVVIRFRVDGVLKEVIRLPRTIHGALIARIKILSSLRVDEHMQPQDGRFKVKMQEVDAAIRVSIIPTFHGEKAALRLLIEEKDLYTMESLGFSPDQTKVLREHFMRPHGMFLVTGPTGSGKTTTLYTILRLRNTQDVNITTIEDPIEYDVSGVNQIQVNPVTNMTFAEGLRSILRQSPDIIMVGEIRDAETAALAVNAALTGHLLMSTLHTNDAIGAVPRLIDLKVEPFLLASTLNLAIAQRLVRRICIDCITTIKLTDAEYQNLKNAVARTSPELAEKTPHEVYKGKGCDVCGGSGYRGRLGIFEFFIVTEKIRALISSGASTDDIKKASRAEGMTTMLEDGLNKVQAGVTTVEEVLRAVSE